jgi:hypothetical protein
MSSLARKISIRIASCVWSIFLLPSLYASTANIPINEVWIVPLSHSDFGYTDHPTVARELQRRYIDIALDAALNTKNNPEGTRFCWTIESLYALKDWWQIATPERRAALVSMVRNGQLDASALALDNTPYMNRVEWEQMTHWVSDDVWKRIRPQTGVQDDVTGFPRAGAVALLERGVHYLWTGINNDLGGAPIARPSGFWWKMPDGQRMFVWLGIPYSEGYYYFHPHGWRRGPLPKAGDTLYRPPSPGELLGTDRESLQNEHDYLLVKLREQVEKGYRNKIFILPFTNQWRIDNDPPYPSLTKFVEVWNGAGLTPKLRIATATQSMEKMEEIAGESSPEYSGEFPDWWANGTMSAPAAVSASRYAKRYLREISSPVLGPVSADVHKQITTLNRDLVVFDEHSWGSGSSIALPYSLDTQGQFAEKSLHAYRPMAEAQFLLGQRVRGALGTHGEGFYAINAMPDSWSGWVRFPSSALRSDYQSATDSGTGECNPIEFEPGMKPFISPTKPEEVTSENNSMVFADNLPKQVARIWVETLSGNSVRRYHLADHPCPVATKSSEEPAPEVELDALGWPVSIKWPGMAKSLISPGFGDFLSAEVRGFAPRAKVHEIWGVAGATKRNIERQNSIRIIDARESNHSELQDTGKTLLYTQSLAHPRLGWAVRQIEIWKSQPRARFGLKIYRLSSEMPEAYFVSFPLPVEGSRPVVSNGGMPYEPYQEQIPGSCKDYFAVDGWVQYETPSGNWIWATRDAPLVTFGEPNLLAKITDEPKNTNRILAMIFNNLWHTNFVANAMGEMDFQFDVQWKSEISKNSNVQDIGDTLVSDPVLLINPSLQTDPLYRKYLDTP